MHELNERQASLLAHILHELRPDWTVNSVFTLLGKHREVPSFGDLVIAAITKANDQTCKTPAPIFLPGNHWPERTRQHINPGPECPDHTGHHAYNCGPCQTDIRLGDRPPHLAGKKLNNGKRTAPPPGYRNNPGA